ncbi:hypothetical protein SAMN05216191_107241 [Paenibacillus jilunlii]|uniref:Uncharacterized protein n=1 Tax=Paenibacillus jilunlii TaxID=682956 RepID=A0A1G9PLB9_9BACL|nr:hypothetical protein SAMN05216191_107241 [Paenibacillus jilunlii]
MRCMCKDFMILQGIPPFSIDHLTDTIKLPLCCILNHLLNRYEVELIHLIVCKEPREEGIVGKSRVNLDKFTGRSVNRLN